MLKLTTALLCLLSGQLVSAQSPGATFDDTVLPILQKTCAGCHNQQMAAGGLNLKAFEHAESVAASREDWEAVLRKVKAGEMPPPGIPKRAGMAAMATWLEREFDRLDKNVKPDPGRVTARHLNRGEYRNTIRDLLGVDFQATQDYDAPAQAMAAVLFAANQKEDYFKLSEAGTIEVLDDGRTRFSPSASGRHRYLIADPAQKERVVKAFTELARAKPIASGGRGSRRPANQPPPTDPPKPVERGQE